MIKISKSLSLKDLKKASTSGNFAGDAELLYGLHTIVIDSKRSMEERLEALRYMGTVVGDEPVGPVTVETLSYYLSEI